MQRMQHTAAKDPGKPPGVRAKNSRPEKFKTRMESILAEHSKTRTAGFFRRVPGAAKRREAQMLRVSLGRGSLCFGRSKRLETDALRGL
jgi:hypothetical protein